jgi:hypothetical protein
MGSFTRARESAVGDAPRRLAADYGLCVGSYVRGELSRMRAHAAAVLADETTPVSGEAGVAHFVQGITHCFAGEILEAQQLRARIGSLRNPTSPPLAQCTPRCSH